MTEPLLPMAMTSAVTRLDTETPGWTLHEGGGSEPRTCSLDVTFALPFATPPLIQVSLAGLDADNAASIRIRIQAKKIDSTGFTILVETWSNSRVYAVEASWLAIGSRA